MNTYALVFMTPNRTCVYIGSVIYAIYCAVLYCVVCTQQNHLHLFDATFFLLATLFTAFDSTVFFSHFNSNFHFVLVSRPLFISKANWNVWKTHAYHNNLMECPKMYSPDNHFGYSCLYKRKKKKVDYSLWRSEYSFFHHFLFLPPLIVFLEQNLIP